MPQTKEQIRVAMPAWEIGRVSSGLGAKVGGLGVIIEELPPELVKAADRHGVDLELEILSPCFAHYDKSRLTKLDTELSVIIDGDTIKFEVYEHVFPDGQKVIYFWDDWQLGWTNSQAIYPNDPQMALTLYAAVSQAMAAYIKQNEFDVIHLHDYHVGLVPFYLGDAYLKRVAAHLTIHNATYQGITPFAEGGYSALDRLNLPGWQLFHKYFDFFDHLNLMKACMLKVHESGGKITTVSGDVSGSWGYAAELKETHDTLWNRAWAQKGSPPGEVFVPNRYLDLFEKLPIAGITNGMGDRNRPENLPELKASVLQAQQAKQGADTPIFRNPRTQLEMLADDHSFDVDRLPIKQQLRRLLHLEAFGHEPEGNPILITTVGRLVAQKNLGLVADVIERVLAYAAETKFIILASAPDGDTAGKMTEGHFARLAYQYPNRVYFNNSFNLPLSKLILAGGDFCLIPSRFEPCGLVDYEASLVGNVVIGRATGGLTKVRHCAYLYEWLDTSDYLGEANAFFYQIKAAVDNYRYNPAHHDYLIRTAMGIDASWDGSANQYINMYLYGLFIKTWHQARENLIAEFAKSLADDLPIFSEFFIPANDDYRDNFDWQMKTYLQNTA